MSSMVSRDTDSMTQGSLVVLAVDDVAEMREMLRLILEGIPEVKSVAVVANVWEARIELTRRRPSIVVLDEVLPGESSLDLVEELRKDQIPVLLVTGIAQRNAPLPEGALDRIFKPDGRHLSADSKRFRDALLKGFPQKKG